MKTFINNIVKWCKEHLWQSILICVALLAVIATSITLPIVLGSKKDAPETPDKVLYGNFITMDETNPTAEAVYIKDGKIEVIGSREDVAEYANTGITVEDYSDNGYIYPGFVDAHSHYAIMSSVLSCGKMIDGRKEGADGWELGDYEAYAKEMKKYVDANPNKEVYQGYGLWVVDNNKYPRGQTPTAAMLDEFCPTDKPVVIIGAGGHDCWLNSAAIRRFIGNHEGTEEEKQTVKKWIQEVGEDCVSVTNTRPYSYIPTGYFCETARFRITDKLPHSIDEIKNSVFEIQDSTLAKGYTTVGDCSIVETSTNKQVTAFKELNEAGKLKIKFRSYYEIREYDSKETRDAQLQYAIQLAEETKNNDYFQVVGIKVFLDGVYEALSANTLSSYTPEAGKADGYKGIQRWYGSLDNDLKELVYKANKAGLAMEFHAMGDAAVRQALDACQYANETLVADGKNAFTKNAISHIGLVNEDDLPRFASLGVNAVVAPQWGPALNSMLSNEIKCVGNPLAETMYPIKSIMDTGANVAFHTDGGAYTAPEMIYSATTRDTVNDSDRGDHIRGINEAITGLDSLKCLTVNAAKVLNSDLTTGVIKAGLPADFTIYNKDYRNNDIASSLQEYKTAKLLALYSNGATILTNK